MRYVWLMVMNRLPPRIIALLSRATVLGEEEERGRRGCRRCCYVLLTMSRAIRWAPPPTPRPQLQIAVATPAGRARVPSGLSKLSSYGL